MPWVRIDDNVLGHQKFEGISYRSFGFWAWSLVYSNRNLTDGKIPRKFVRTKTQMALALEMERRTLWDKVEGGWMIHDFLHYGKSKEQVELERKQARERQDRWRERHVTQKESVTNGLPFLTVPNHTSPLDSNAVTPTNQDPLPELSQEERAANIKRLAKMTAEVAASKAMPR